MYPKMYIQSASNFQKLISKQSVYNQENMNSNLNVKTVNNSPNITIKKKKQTLKELLTPIQEEVVNEVKENAEKQPKGKWKLDLLEPLTKEVKQTLYFKSLTVLAKEVPLFNYDTWRNIALGRSKTYQKFIRLEKI